MHFPVGLSNGFLASSIADFISPTPEVTAFNFINLYLVVLLITLAKDVLPEPVGPHKIILDNLSAFIVLYRILSLPKISSCPINSSSVCGLTRWASGIFKSFYSPL